jgi:uncharacterized integral membrane protein (TIGR00697 family)
MIHNDPYSRNPLKIDSRCILPLAMLYLVFSIAADVVAFKFSNYFGYVQTSSTILFPATYILADVICEVYGWTTAMRIVWFGLFCEAIFAGCILLVIHIPAYGHGFPVHQKEYYDTLGGIGRFVMGGIISNIFAGLLNIYCISKWKVRADGKYFWIRSIASTCLSEFVLVVITIFIAFPTTIHMHEMIILCRNAYVLEIIYAIIFVVPAQFIVAWLKKVDRINAFDYHTSYNPFLLIDKLKKTNK